MGVDDSVHICLVNGRRTIRQFGSVRGDHIEWQSGKTTSIRRELTGIEIGEPPNPTWFTFASDEMPDACDGD